MKSLDQRRAAAAYAAMEGADPDTLRMARKLPAMLQTNGLLATWAFLLSKGNIHAGILSALLQHLGPPPAGLNLVQATDATEAFLGWVGGKAGADGGVGGTELRDLTAEALAFAGWLKRAAESQGEPELEGEGISDAAY